MFALEFGMSISNTGAGQSLELRVLNTNHACETSSETNTSRPRKGNQENKMIVNKKLAKLLDDRLRILEEEGEILKGEFLRSVKERAELINEVRNRFEDMHYLFRLNKSQESGDIPSDGDLAITPFKKERTGLLQVLCQESNPSLLIRSPSSQAGPG